MINEIISLMKETSARISLGDCWMVYDDETRMWIVYQRKYGARKTTILCAVYDADVYNAVQIMRNENF